jgi:alpha-L-rhamnosidase
MTPFINNPTWIGMAADENSNCAPLLRREFQIDGAVSSATLRVCGLGYYEAWINGRRVGDHVLDPAPTDYGERVFYVSYEVSDLLRSGANTIGVMLGNGWYNQDRVWSKKVVHDDGSTSAVTGLSYGQPRLLAELRVIYQDGRTDALHTDTGWRWTPGPIVDNNIYAGEVYDARREVDGWCLPEFDDSPWPSVSVLPPPGGTLEEQVVPPMRRIEERRPTKISHVGKGEFVVDLGQNVSGWARIRVEAPAGTEIKMRFAETIFADGTIDTASTGVFATTVEQIDRYICRGKGLETWEPRFTYHGFRYIEVSGWPGELTPDAITGIVVHSDLEPAGAFECSDERLNRLHRMALWTHRANIHGLPEDCPARERCGWLGDANLVAEYSLWNFQAKAFWEKYLGDIETSRTINNGIPGRVTPGKRCSEPAGKFDWLATYIMLPYYIYQDTGDADVLRAHWDGMEHLMAYFESEADGWILRGGYGDYFDPGTDGIVMHTPPSLTTTLWFFRCAGVMAAAAGALDNRRCAAQYRDWQRKIALALTERHFDPATGSFGSQTADAMALAFGVAPAEEDRILNALVSDIRARDMHPNVGVMGVRFLFEVLTRRGHGDIALALMHQDSYPSFGHLIERGATTLWECWGEKEHDEKHGARSLNHPFMGGYDNWFYNTLAGIRPEAEHPGFKQFTLAPHPIPGLDWVRCHHDCRYGRIVSNWTMDSGTFEWHIEVPAGASALARLPFSGAVRALAAGTHDLTD